MRLPIAMLGTVAALLLSRAVGFVCAEETEEQAVAAIEKLGGTIDRDEDKPGKPVRLVRLDRTKIRDAGLVHLQRLKTLEVLALRDTKISNTGLVHLKTQRQLECLLLGGTDVTDAGLVHLKKLERLRYLQLFKTKVTDAGVKALQKALPKCEIIR